MASYKGNQNHTFSHTSSTSPSPSSSSSQHKGLFPPVSYSQNQHHRGWLEGQRHVDETALRCYSGGGGGGSQLDFSLDARNDGGGGEDDGDGDGDGIDDHGATRQGNSSEAQVDSGGGVGGQVVVEREHMFDKVVTPSDVGKLNRLVIPKQHAEKYFPLHSSTNEKGLLLNFEDRNGKPWRFRYSYWNSSQSYVMTKGWSRFVKEKKLDAGDIVSFQRGVGESGKDRLFIDWRRRPDAPIELPSTLPSFSFPHHFSFHHRTIYPWNQNNPLYLQPQPAARDYSHLLQPNPNSYGYSNSPYSQNAMGNSIPSVIYFRSAAATAAVDPPQAGMVQMQRSGSGVEHPMVFESMPVVHGKAAAKRLRLFGVNMECPISDSDECDILSSTTTTIMPHSSAPTVAMAMSPHPNPPHSHLPHPYSSSSSNSSFVPSLQLKPYNGTPPPSMPPDLLNKGKSSISLDLDLDLDM